MPGSVLPIVANPMWVPWDDFSLLDKAASISITFNSLHQQASSASFLWRFRRVSFLTNQSCISNPCSSLPQQHFCSTHKARWIPQAVVRLHNLFPFYYFLPPAKSIAPLACAHSFQSPHASHTLSNSTLSIQFFTSPVATMSLCQNRLNEERYVQPATSAASGALH